MQVESAEQYELKYRHRNLRVFSWLKGIVFGRKVRWKRAVQPPRVPINLPLGTKLRALEEVIIGFPTAVFGDDEPIGSVLISDNKAEFTVPPGSDTAYIKLKSGMTFSLTKNCQVFVYADDDRPRRFEVSMPAEQKVAGA